MTRPDRARRRAPARPGGAGRAGGPMHAALGSTGRASRTGLESSCSVSTLAWRAAGNGAAGNGAAGNGAAGNGAAGNGAAGNGAAGNGAAGGGQFPEP